MNTSLQFIGDLNPWLGLLLAFALAALAYWLYHRETRERSDRLRWLLPTLRAAAVFLAVLALTGPILHHERVIRELGKLFVFVDGSKSMQMTDQAMLPERKVATMQAMGMLERDDAFGDASEASTHLARAQFAAERAITAGPESETLKDATKRVAEGAEKALEAYQSLTSKSAGFVPAPGLLLSERYPVNDKFFDRGFRMNADRHPAPIQTRFLDQFRFPQTTETEFMVWIRGYLIAPQDGKYRFWVSSDDQGQLWLSQNEDPRRAEMIARVDSWTEAADFDANGAQRSRQFELKKGQRYYMEAIFYAGTGENHLSVAWQTPAASQRVSPIKGEHFIPIAPAHAKGPKSDHGLQRYQEEMVNRSRTLADAVNAGSGDPFAHIETLRELNNELTAMRTQLREHILAKSSAYYAANAGSEAFKEKLTAFDAMTRTQRIERLLLDPDFGMLAKLAEQQDVEFVALRDTDVDSLWWQRRGGRKSAGPLPYEINLVDSGSKTDLGEAIKKTIGEAEQGVGVLLYSDGQHNIGSSPVAAAKVLGEQGISMFTIGTGALDSPEDMAVLDVIAPQTVYSKDRVKGVIKLRDSMRTATEFDLQVLADGEPVWKESFFSSGIGEREFEYDFPVEELVTKFQDDNAAKGVEFGSVPLAFEVKVTARANPDSAPAPDATDSPELAATPNSMREHLEQNNSKPMFVQAVALPRKVLLIDARPRWETRYLHNMFERDEQWQVNPLMEVFTAADKGRTWERGTTNGTFPDSREELFKYESVVIGDVPAFLFKEEEMGWLTDFVEKRGGGVVFIDGQRGHLRGLVGTPLEKLLPVKWISPADAPHEEEDMPETLFLSASGESFSPLRFASTGAENAEIWQRLRPPHWSAQVRELPGTEVLARAQFADERRLPALVWRRLGAGKVLYSATDELWRWRYNVADRYHQKFWVQLANWVGEKPYSVAGERASIGADKLVYSPGEAATLRVRIRDENGRPVSKGEYVAVLYDEDDNIAAEIELQADDNAGGVFRGRSGELRSGEYTVAVRQKYFLKKATEFDARAELIVKDASDREMDDLALNSELLKNLSHSSGGQFFLEEETHSLVNLLESIDRKKVIPSQTVLWSSYWWFAAIIGLLTVEWILRKKNGYV